MNFHSGSERVPRSTNPDHGNDPGLLGYPRAGSRHPPASGGHRLKLLEEKKYPLGDGGETEEEKIRVDVLENQVMDVRLCMAMICYSSDFLTYVHFLAYDILDMHRTFEPRCLDEFPNLKDFTSRFEGLKKISAYMKSSCFLPGPLFLKTAMWGNKYCPVTRRRE
ncbi:glutathione S-transferase Mu 1-like isoform X2 [Pseudorca crassidens]|uniref:glutathione S-transferase Mu 1-like isoform X2 n=1 Tax=Pseudorca crassidens TaxID=82174 RepID=UPI00352BF604